MKAILIGIFVLVWLYLLSVLKRGQLHFWRFVVGSMGTFLILMGSLQDWLTEPLARMVAALAGIVGTLTGGYTAYFKYGIIFITSQTQSMTLLIDYECSGIIEIIAFLSLLMFFEVYSRYEKVIISLIGIVYLMAANALRITLICFSVHFFGVPAYYIVHSFVGRILFYTLSVLLYFYVFTKPQVIHMKVGNFSYGNSRKNH